MPDNAPHSQSDSSRVREVHELPGPRRLPLLGNLHMLGDGQFHSVAEQWSLRYGDVFRIYLGTVPVLALADTRVAASVLRDRPEGFGRGLRIDRIASEMGLHGLFTANGDAWRRQRPMVMSALDPSHIRSYFPSLISVTERLMRRWQKAARAGSPIDLQSDLMRYTVDVTAGLAFGTEMNTLETEGDRIQEHLDHIFPALNRRLLSPVAYWRYFKLPRDYALDAHLAAVHRAVDGFIVAARERMNANPDLHTHPRNLIEAMIAERDRPGSDLTDQDVAGNVLTMLLAGEDTTANTLAWMLHLLHQHPAWQKRLHDEADSLVRASVPEDPGFAAAAQVADACANEAMRLKPVAPFLFAEALREQVIEGVRVPERGLVMLLLRRAATDERNFAAPLAFEPERWIETEQQPAGLANPKRVSMPFGAGPRLCPGRYLALLEIKMVIAMLFRNFTIEHIGCLDDAPVRERLSFTMEPVGLQMRLKQRQHA